LVSSRPQTEGAVRNVNRRDLSEPDDRYRRRESPSPRTAHYAETGREPQGYGYGEQRNQTGANGFWPVEHSTAARGNHQADRSDWQARKNMLEESRYIDRRGQSSSFIQAKSIKVAPFPKEIKASDKLFRWKFWLSTLEMALERNEIWNQRERAVELSLSVGEEVSLIIMTENLMKDPLRVGHDFPFYDHLVEGISMSFGALTDSGMNAREFKVLKAVRNQPKIMDCE
jgi:hypothetical protein